MGMLAKDKSARAKPRALFGLLGLARRDSRLNGSFENRKPLVNDRI